MTDPKYVVVFDFDGTLMPKYLKSLYEMIDCVLSQKYQEEIESLRRIYLPKILANQITPEEDMIMVSRPAQIYVESGLTISKAAEALAKVNLREGVVETMKFLNQRRIPVAVISYSYSKFIEMVLENHKIQHLVSRVYGPGLIIEDGIICGYDPATFVFSKNKGLFSQAFAKQHGIFRGNILAVGDSAADCNLGYLKENRLGIAKDEAEKEKIQKYFGEVVITETFEPVLEWLKKKIKTA